MTNCGHKWLCDITIQCLLSYFLLWKHAANNSNFHQSGWINTFTIQEYQHQWFSASNTLDKGIYLSLLHTKLLLCWLEGHLTPQIKSKTFYEAPMLGHDLYWLTGNRRHNGRYGWTNRRTKLLKYPFNNWSKMINMHG